MFIKPSIEPLSQNELEQLNDFLSSSCSKTKPMSLTELHGFFCALMSAPNLIMPSKWQPIVLGGEPEFESLEEAQKIIGMIMQLNNQVSCQLRGEQLFEFLLWENNTKIPYKRCSFDLLAKWCKGYLRGANMDAQWSSEEHVFTTLFPFSVLSNMFGKNEEIESDKKKFKAHLLKYVKDNYKYWSKARKNAATICSKPNQSKTRKIKIGRNELCICGSGKKYKKCCGYSSRVLH